MSGSFSNSTDLGLLDREIDTSPSDVEFPWFDINDSDTVIFPPEVKPLPPSRETDGVSLPTNEISPDLEAATKRFLAEQGFTGEVGKKLLSDIRPLFAAAQDFIFRSNLALTNQSFEKPPALKNRKRGRKVQINIESVDLEQIRAARRLVVTYHRRKRTDTINLKPCELERIKAAESLVNAYNRARRKYISLSL